MCVLDERRDTRIERRRETYRGTLTSSYTCKPLKDLILQMYLPRWDEHSCISKDTESGRSQSEWEAKEIQRRHGEVEQVGTERGCNTHPRV